MPEWKKRSRYSHRKGGRKARSAPISSNEKLSPGWNAVGDTSPPGASARRPPDGAHEPGGGIVQGTGAMRASSWTGGGGATGSGSAAVAIDAPAPRAEAAS